jgi:hypothetical protein
VSKTLDVFMSIPAADNIFPANNNALIELELRWPGRGLVRLRRMSRRAA